MNDNPERNAREHTRTTADEVECERAEELSTAKRSLTDESREVVERLRGLYVDCGWQDVFDALFGITFSPTGAELRNRLCDLIEHGGKKDAARERAADWVQEKGGLREVGVRFDRPHNIVREIARAGMIDLPSKSLSGDVETIKLEIDKRLMPINLTWPRFSDGKQVACYDAPQDAVGVSIALDGSCYWLEYDVPDLPVWESDERVLRSKPAVLGADGMPILEGETVWDSTSPHDPESDNAWRHGGPLKVLRRNDVRPDFIICENDQGAPLDCCAADLTHERPDTKERIEEDKDEEFESYWGCEGSNCEACPSLIGNKKPCEHYGVSSCAVAQGMDIARREHKFKARMTRDAEYEVVA